MRKTGIVVRLWTAGAVLLTVLFSASVPGALWFGRDRKPLLSQVSAEAVQQTERLMEAVCSGDFAEAEQLLYGTPSLGCGRQPEDPVGAMIWQAYLGSLDYMLVGEVYASDTGLVQDVKLISLELDTVTENLGLRARALLQKAVEEAREVSDLYDEENQFREELIQSLLEEAARQALSEDVRYTYEIIPVQLICREGQWHPVADQAFLKAVSGGITG